MYIHFKIDIDKDGLDKIIEVLHKNEYRPKGSESDRTFIVKKDSLYGSLYEFKSLELLNKITESSYVKVCFNLIPNRESKTPVIYRQQEMFEEITEILKQYGEAEIK